MKQPCLSKLAPTTWMDFFAIVPLSYHIAGMLLVIALA